MGIKLAVIFVIVCLTSLALAHKIQIVDQPNNIEAQAEFLTVIANGIFGKVSSFLQAKLNIVLWVKQLLIQGIIKVISYTKYLILHNSAFVGDMITLFSDLVRLVVLNLPHFNVPLVVKTFTKLLPLPYGQY